MFSKRRQERVNEKQIVICFDLVYCIEGRLFLGYNEYNKTQSGI